MEQRRLIDGYPFKDNLIEVNKVKCCVHCGKEIKSGGKIVEGLNSSNKIVFFDAHDNAPECNGELTLLSSDNKLYRVKGKFE